MGDQANTTNWRTQLRKGYIDLCLLNCLSSREMYGYDFVQMLKQLDGVAIREGIIYPILARMQEEGLVTSEVRPSTSGPPRKYYRITEQGRRTLEEMNRLWGQMVDAMRLAESMGRGGQT